MYKENINFTIIILSFFLIFGIFLIRKPGAQTQIFSMPSTAQLDLPGPYWDWSSSAKPSTSYSYNTTGQSTSFASSSMWNSWGGAYTSTGNLFGSTTPSTYSWWWQGPILPITPFPWLPVSQKKLEYKIVTDKSSYDEGEPVKITFSVTNKMPTPITLNFSSGKQFDIAVREDTTLRLIWQLSISQSYTMALTTLTLAPFETKSFQTQWEQEDNSGVSAIPANYTIEGFLTPVTTAYQERAATKITIKKMVINESYNNKTIYLKKESSMRIELSANPSTGYKWFADWDKNKLFLNNYMYINPTNSLLGMSGKDVWIFRALALGTTSVSFKYRRQWETNAQATKTMNFTIVIQSNLSELLGRKSAFVSAGTDGDYYSGAYGGYASTATGAPALGEVIRTSSEQIAREIEEADIIKIDGTHLYLLNSYRGLIICDIHDPRSPVILSRTSVESGMPEDMYIRDGRAYIIVNNSYTDPYYATDIFKIQAEGDVFIPSPSSALSKVIVMNISNKSTPSIISSFDVEGSVTDSRIVGNILYVVASEYSYYSRPFLGYGVEGSMGMTIAKPVTTLYPAMIEEGYTLSQEPNEIRASTGSGTATFTTTATSTTPVITTVTNSAIATATSTSTSTPTVTSSSTEEPGIIAPEYMPPMESQQKISILSIDISDPLHIREIDRSDFEGFTNNIHVTDKAIFVESTQYNYPETNTEITYVDIADPMGLIDVRGSIKVRGSVEDKFKMDFYDGYFRVCTYEWTETGGLSNLSVIDFKNPDSPTIISAIMLGKGEQLFATRFDEERAYMVTFERIDPLWVIDLSDPYNPEVKGELEVTGWSTHIEPRGDRLVALGVDDTTGRMVSVSLFDVSDPGNPSLMKRVSFGDKDGWSTTEAYGDVKAFTILDEIGLILLPYSTYTYTGVSSMYDNRLQLIDYTGDDLKARGWVSQKGSLLRSRSFADHLFSVSADEIQVINAEDRDNPMVVASATLAQNIIGAVLLNNGYVVRLISQNFRDYSLSTVPLSDPEDGPVASEVMLDSQNMPSIISNGNFVYVLMPHFESFAQPLTEPAILPADGSDLVEPQEIPRIVESSTIRIIDFTNVTKPRERGSLDVPGFYDGIRPLNGSLPVSSYLRYNVVQVKNDILVFNKTQSYYYPYLYSEVNGIDAEQEEFSGFIIADLSNPDKPRIASQISFDEAYPQTIFAKNGTFYYSYSQQIDKDDQKRSQSQYYLSRINLSNPSQPVGLKKINIPGYCVGINDTGDFAYTIDNEWSSEEDNPTVLDYTFNVVRIVGDTAYLFDTVELEGASYTAIINGGYAYLSGSGFYGYGYYGYGTSMLSNVRVSYPYYYGGMNEFMIIDLSNPEKLLSYKHATEGISLDMLGAKGNKIFINSSGGIGCYSVSDPQQPVLDEFIGGYSGWIVFSADKAFIPLGYAGLWVKGI